MTSEETKNMRRIELREEPFKVTGLPWLHKTGCYDRIPANFLPQESTALFLEIAAESSGGVARIRTNASRIFFEAKVRQVKTYMYHMSRMGRSGFDFHIRRLGEPLRFLQASVPIEYGKTSFSCEVMVQRSGLYDERPQDDSKPAMYELRIVFPTYNAVDEACVYVDADCEVLSPEPQAYQKPVLFYGSSITQGACASRPSNCYTNRLALALDCPITNFGFSGHAMGESAMARMIAQQEMCMFVMDYDHNAPNVDYLKKTHRPFFEIVRMLRPEIPVVLVSKCDFGTSLDDNTARRRVIRETYENAVRNGDRSVYFVDGESFFAGARDFCTVDGCHPNDLGFDRMARSMEPLLRSLLSADGGITRLPQWQS